MHRLQGGETQLQRHLVATQLGVTVKLSPRMVLAELAGEGVEYCWVLHAKAYYCRAPLSRYEGATIPKEASQKHLLEKE